MTLVRAGTSGIFMEVPNRQMKQWKKMGIEAQPLPKWELASTGVPGSLGINPPDSSDLPDAGKIILAPYVSQPGAVCQLLAKMAVETIALDNLADARSPKFEDVRNIARAPRKGTKWWFFVSINSGELFHTFRHGITMQQWHEGVAMTVTDIGGAEMFYLDLPHMRLCLPLESIIFPDPGLDELPKPDNELVQVEF